MTAQFHEGQEVEVLKPDTAPADIHGLFYKRWAAAKIIRYVELGSIPKGWLVQFHDGTRAVFDAEHIREVQSRAEIAQDFLKHAILRNGERKILERIAKGLP